MIKYFRQSSGMDFIDGIRHKRVYKFDDFRDTEHISMVFGKKATNLCLINRIDIPVPPGFIISSESYFDYLKDGAKIYEKLENSYAPIILELESETGRRFSPSTSELSEIDKFPILLSIRPSCGVADLRSVPNSVLNIGLNDEIVSYIIDLTGNALFGLDLYRRFLNQFGITVLGIRPSVYVGIEHQIMRDEKVSDINSLSVSGMERLVQSFREVTEIPPDGTQQLLMTIDAMYDWWVRNHPEEKTLTYGMSGLALIVQEMVYGNMNYDTAHENNEDHKHRRPYHRSTSSGSGVVYCTPFTRGFFGHDLTGTEIMTAQKHHIAELDVLEQLQETDPEVYRQIKEYALKIKREISPQQDDDTRIEIDFTIQNGVVFVLEVKEDSKISQLISFVDAQKNDDETANIDPQTLKLHVKKASL